MSKKLKDLRRTVVRAISDPETWKEEVSQKLRLRGSASQARAHTADELLDPTLLDRVASPFSLQDMINGKKSDMPLRLICTEDGKLYDQHAVEERFKAEYAHFFEPTAESCDSKRMSDAVESSFAYAMFSHRWEKIEPLFKDLHGSDVFSLAESPGTKNLQNFVRHARERGFRWVWSDSCCIDKHSSSELTRSITSMFRWYRNSDLTIVYLGDVSDNSIEALRKSVWFFRGWTLQELIAPRHLLFFQSDWTLLITSPDLPLHNYKDSPTFRNLISEITGIDDCSLTQFDPVSHPPKIRDRMSWAAHRRTTEPEDVAYSLMGIFNVSMPVLYGEGSEKAFSRLQKEIMDKSVDPSLFEWMGKPGSDNTFLASSPACFDPFTNPIIRPVPVTIQLAEMMRRLPLVPKIQRNMDRLGVGLFNMQKRMGVNVQHPANYMAGNKVHCHGLEYSVLDVEEARPVPNAPESPSVNGREPKVFRYHIIAESLHPVTVTLAEPIRTGFGYGRIHSEYMCIFRVWDQCLATGMSTDDDASGNHPLRQPFVAHLLISQASGVYKRIQVKERIVAKLSSFMEFSLSTHLRTLVIE